MNNKVGEKIKALRKELNMTQTQLAGKEMTKSMLSQIENNVSNPSMKTLQYIASQLNKPVSYFLEEQNDDNNSFAQHNNKLKQEQEVKIKVISELINSAQIEEAQRELERLIDNSAINKSFKSYADILLKLGSTLIKFNNLEPGKRYITFSIQAYIKGSFYIEGAKAYVELAKGFYQEFNYEECLNICHKAFELYYKDINTDPLFEIELYYYKIIILSAIGDIENAVKTIETALSLSAKTSIYYRTAELHRLKGIFNYLQGNKAEYNKSIEKALQFAQFSEDKICLSKIHIILAAAALDTNDAEKALEHDEMSSNSIEKNSYIYYLIKARAYYILGNYELAYENILKVDFPAYEKHKYDYLNMWSAKVYEGLILSKLGKHSEAIKVIKIGIKKMSIFDNSKFLVSAYKSLSEVYSNKGDFQNAFIYLKKANEIQDIINKDASIVF